MGGSHPIRTRIGATNRLAAAERAAQNPRHSRSWHNVISSQGIEKSRILRGFDPDMAIGHLIAMILQSNVTLAFEIFQRGFELVFGAIRVLAGLPPAIQIHVDDAAAVQVDLQHVVAGSNHH